jgi:hypothetical protein
MMSLLSQINTKKLLLSLILVFGFSSSVFAECISGDCNNGYGTYLWNDGSGEQYVGEWKNDEFHGFGTYTFGKGKWEGDQYVGEFKNGARDGQGTYIYANGNKYTGELKNGRRDGLGAFTWADGDKYIGEYKNDRRDGEGTYTYSDGTSDRGIWKNNEFIETN